MSKARYAIYYSPDMESPLWLFGSRWLGRDTATGDDMKRLSLKGVEPSNIIDITKAPRHYGFHATLKPPFQLAKNYDREMLDEAMEAFSSGHKAFKVPALELVQLDGFIALRPKKPCADLDDFAADCVRSFDNFRASPSKKDVQKRLKADLTKGQKKMLEKWGYPYVLDEYRFHMTLTDRLKDDQRKIVMAGLKKKLDGVLTGKSWMFNTVTLMRQKKPDQMFEVLKCYALMKPRRTRWPLKKH